MHEELTQIGMNKNKYKCHSWEGKGNWHDDIKKQRRKKDPVTMCTLSKCTRIRVRYP